jgi:methylglutaconyl-CoA hydratase
MIRYENEDNVAYITLDTPEHSNKFTFQLMNDFIDALTAAAQSDAIAIVLRATGTDFTLGRDQGEKLAHVSRTDSLRLILKANAALKRFPGVSVALIQGRCMGFGTGLAIHSDISIGAHDAVLGFDEVKHGLAPLVVQTYLSRYIGPKRAHELVLTGRDVAADEAVQLGLLTKSVAADRLADEGKKLVADLKTLSAAALRRIHRFDNELTKFKGNDAGEFAIERLVQWIEAGKP